MEKKSLAQFVATTRDNLGLSQRGLAMKSNLPLEVIESIESGQELFLATSIRQKLAKGLKINPQKLKEFEKQEEDQNEVPEYINQIRVMILAGETTGLKCPVCQSELICKIEEMYDLDDELVRHPKARCSKCPFQVK